MESAAQSNSALPCDQCRKRKIRCNYASPCDRCQSRGLGCTFSSVRKKRGPKTSRGKIIDQLRRSSANTSASLDGPIADIQQTSHHVTPESFDDSIPTAPRVGEPFAEPPFNTSPQEILHSNDDEAIFAGYESLAFDEFAHSILESSLSWPDPASVADPQSAGLSSTSDLPLASANTILGTPSEVSEVPRHRGDQINKVVQRGVDLFFTHMYPIYPIVDQALVRSYLSSQIPLGPAEVCLLWSMTALSLVHVEDWPGTTAEQRTTTGRKYIRKCLQARVDFSYIEESTFADVCSSLFISVSYFELKCRKASWHYVRQAVTLAHIAGVQNAIRDTTIDFTERLRRQRAYAILFVTERGASILNNFPVSILTPPGLQGDALLDEDPAVSTGLSCLYHLFSLLDFNFVRLWNDFASESLEHKGYQELATLQNHLRQTIDLRGVSEIQRADVLITQQWLRLVFWQSALRMGFISTSAAEPAFTYTYPIEIAATTCEIIKSLPPVAIQVHGLGIFEKEFEIAYSLLDTLTLTGTSQLAAHYETLRYLLLSLSASPNSRQVYVRTLQTKMDHDNTSSTGEKKYRNLAGVQLIWDRSESRHNSRRHSLVPEIAGQRGP